MQINWPVSIWWGTLVVNGLSNIPKNPSIDLQCDNSFDWFLVNGKIGINPLMPGCNSHLNKHAAKKFKVCVTFFLPPGNKIFSRLVYEWKETHQKLQNVNFFQEIKSIISHVSMSNSGPGVIGTWVFSLSFGNNWVLSEITNYN